jgi:hypothetical protein
MKRIKNDELYDIFISREALLELKELQKLYGNGNYSETILKVAFLLK